MRQLLDVQPLQAVQKTVQRFEGYIMKVCLASRITKGHSAFNFFYIWLSNNVLTVSQRELPLLDKDIFKTSLYYLLSM